MKPARDDVAQEGPAFGARLGCSQTYFSQRASACPLPILQQDLKNGATCVIFCSSLAPKVIVKCACTLFSEVSQCALHLPKKKTSKPFLRSEVTCKTARPGDSDHAQPPAHSDAWIRGSTPARMASAASNCRLAGSQSDPQLP